MLKYKCKNCGNSLGFQGLCWKCRQEKTRREVLSWSQEEINCKIKQIIINVEKVSDYGSEENKNFRYLLTCHGIVSQEVARKAVKSKMYYPAEIYYNAPADVRDELIKKLLATEDSLEANRILSCLGMQGDDISLKTLLELDKNPLPWRKELHVDASSYAQCGNWSFNKYGNRIELGFDICYPLVKGKKDEDNAVVVGYVREDVCPNCGCHMVDILSLDCRDSRLQFLELNGIVTATCCPNCTCFTEATFSRFTLDGGSIPICSKELIDDEMENYINEEDLKKLSENNFVLGKAPVPVFYGVLSDDVNTIGGFANWVQDWEYTKCPDCGKTMKYLAQVHWDTVMDGYEGTIYIEICSECKIVSMHHQQT